MVEATVVNKELEYLVRQSAKPVHYGKTLVVTEEMVQGMTADQLDKYNCRICLGMLNLKMV